MNSQNALTSTPQAELVYLQEELEVRDQLVQQLSEELFRLIQTSSYFNPEQQESLALPFSTPLSAIAPASPDQDTWENYGEEVAAKDEEIFQLHHIIDELKERCQLLENVVQEFPHIYRRKFSERMQPVRDKMLRLQQENRSLRAELQAARERIAYYESYSPAPVAFSPAQ